jgi:N utilization substance protein B
MKERSRARSWAVQALYAWETRGGDVDRLVPVVEELAKTLEVSPRNRFYGDALTRIVARNFAPIDDAIRRNLRNWTVARLSAIDRNILRIGVAELLYVDDVPKDVTLSEMKRLAERFGTEESPRFVNAVLEAVAAEVEPGGDLAAT